MAKGGILSGQMDNVNPIRVAMSNTNQNAKKMSKWKLQIILILYAVNTFSIENFGFKKCKFIFENILLF